MIAFDRFTAHIWSRFRKEQSIKIPKLTFSTFKCIFFLFLESVFFFTNWNHRQIHHRCRWKKILQAWLELIFFTLKVQFSCEQILDCYHLFCFPLFFMPMLKSITFFFFEKWFWQQNWRLSMCNLTILHTCTF